MSTHNQLSTDWTKVGSVVGSVLGSLAVFGGNWRSNNATSLMQLFFFILSTFPFSTVTADEQQTDDDDCGTVQ